MRTNATGKSSKKSKDVSLGGTPIKKKDGAARRIILKRTPKRYQDPVLWAWLEIFPPLRGTNSETKLKIS